MRRRTRRDATATTWTMRRTSTPSDDRRRRRRRRSRRRSRRTPHRPSTEASRRSSSASYACMFDATRDCHCKFKCALVFLQWIHFIHWDKSVCVGRTRRVSTVDFDGRTDGLTDGRVSVVFTYRRFCCVWTTHAASRWEFDLI